MNTTDHGETAGDVPGEDEPTTRSVRWGWLTDRLDWVADKTGGHETLFLKRVKAGKSALQMLVGSLMVFVLIVKAALRVMDLWGLSAWCPDHLSHALLRLPTLTIVGRSLAYSAGIELAYMLFTPGPDEVINPVIVSLAASILIIISAERPSFEGSTAVAVASLVIWLLLFLKKHYEPQLKD